MIDGVHSQHFFGTGVIVHHSETMGLAAVDKNTVAVSVSDVMLSFAAYPMEIPGEVETFSYPEFIFVYSLYLQNFDRSYFCTLFTIMLLLLIIHLLWVLVRPVFMLPNSFLVSYIS